MQFQFDVATSQANPTTPQQPTSDSVPDLLRLVLEQQREQLQVMSQLLEIEKEQLNHQRGQAQDALTRWRNLLARWQKDHPDFAERCKKAYPAMEKMYVQLLVNMVDDLALQEDDAYESDFAVQEFLDKYGMRIGQLSHLLSVVGPLSEAAHQSEANKQP